MATCVTRSRSVHEPCVALPQTDLTDGSVNVGDTPDPQSPDLHTATPLECIDTSLSPLAGPISLQEELLALHCQMAVMQEKLDCAETSVQPSILPAQPV